MGPPRGAKLEVPHGFKSKNGSRSKVIFPASAVPADGGRAPVRMYSFPETKDGGRHGTRRPAYPADPGAAAPPPSPAQGGRCALLNSFPDRSDLIATVSLFVEVLGKCEALKLLFLLVTRRCLFCSHFKTIFLFPSPAQSLLKTRTRLEYITVST